MDMQEHWAEDAGLIQRQLLDRAVLTCLWRLLSNAERRRVLRYVEKETIARYLVYPISRPNKETPCD